MSNDPTHEFIRPGQVAPDRPVPDACMVCGRPEAEHTAATYVAEATAADKMLDELLANIRHDAGTGEISAVEAADERIQVMEEHLAAIRGLREKYFGGNPA